jgi:hypothetical protein
MSKRTKTWEALTFGVLSVGGIIAARAIYGVAQRTMKRANQSFNPHQYAVMYSINGGDFHYRPGEGGEPEEPLTKDQAIADARRFTADAVSIKGQAKVVNIVTSEEIPF